MHAVDIDSAHVAAMAAQERAAAESLGYRIIGVPTSQLRPGDLLVPRAGESWSGHPQVRHVMPGFTSGTWQIDLVGHRSVRTCSRRLSVWRPFESRASVA